MFKGRPGARPLAIGLADHSSGKPGRPLGGEPGGCPGLPSIDCLDGLPIELPKVRSAGSESMGLPSSDAPLYSSDPRGVCSPDTFDLGLRTGTRVDVEMEACSVDILEMGCRCSLFS